MNWALSFVVKISLGAFYGILAAAISTYVNQIPAKVIVAFVIVVALISYYLIIRICPMEEVDDE